MSSVALLLTIQSGQSQLTRAGPAVGAGAVTGGTGAETGATGATGAAGLAAKSDGAAVTGFPKGTEADVDGIAANGVVDGPDPKPNFTVEGCFDSKDFKFETNCLSDGFGGGAPVPGRGVVQAPHAVLDSSQLVKHSWHVHLAEEATEGVIETGTTALSTAVFGGDSFEL